MLVAIYYPFSDERVFFPERTRLVESRFIKVGESHRFSRNLGTIINRPRDGFTGWIGESIIGSIRKSIRVDLASSSELDGYPVRTAFKRFYFDGLNAGYFSLGLSLPDSYFDPIVEAGTVEAFLGHLLSVAVSSDHRKDAKYTVETYSDLASDLYAAGSMRRLKGLADQSYRKGVRRGRPLVIVSAVASEFDAGGAAVSLKALAENFEPVRRQRAGAHTILTSSMRGANGSPVFLICSESGRDAAASRFLRSGIARLYVQLFALERAIAILQSSIFEKVDAEGQTLLGQCVSISFQRLEGADTPKIQVDEENYDNLIRSFTTSYRPGLVTDLENIIVRLQARPNLRKVLRQSRVALASAAQGAIFIENYAEEGDVIVDNRTGQTGGIHVSGGALNTGGGDAVGGDQTKIIQSNIQEQVNQAFAPVAAAIANAPADKQAAAAQQLNALKEEAAKGEGKAEDGVVAKLVDGLIGLVPTAVSAIVSAFATPILGGIAGPVTKFVLDKAQGK